MGDLKTLGKTDLGVLLKWRMKIIREKERTERKSRKEAAKVDGDQVDSGTKAKSAKKVLEKDVDDAIDAFLDEVVMAGRISILMQKRRSWKKSLLKKLKNDEKTNAA